MWSCLVDNLSFLCRNLSPEFILLTTFTAMESILLITFAVMESPDSVSSDMQPKHATFECCFIFVYFYNWCLVFGTFFISHLEAKSIDLVLSSLKRMLILLSTDHSQMFVKSLFNYFSISITCFPWKARQESSAYRNRFDLTVWGMSFMYVRNSKSLRMDPCGIIQVILGSE